MALVPGAAFDVGDGGHRMRVHACDGQLIWRWFEAEHASNARMDVLKGEPPQLDWEAMGSMYAQ